MTVGELLHALDQVPGLTRSPSASSGPVLDAPCTGVTHDSRRAGRGAIFVALVGLKANGAVFAPQAIAAGASAVVAESPAPADVTVPWVVVTDASHWRGCRRNSSSTPVAR
jgi:UDP-N-acetylmuramoyl-L-alanyl-D-glutamate--2,6-diaminopimelate ligase